jgi:alanine dehydrogenase
LLLLDEGDVRRFLSTRDAIEALDKAFRAQAEGRLDQPLRTIATADGGVLGAMPASLRGASAALGAKLVTFFRGNAQLGKHTHQALIALFDPQTGEALAVMDGRYITEIRTAAASALATRCLARAGASIVAIIGSGVQAAAHVTALADVMPIRELRVWGRTAAHAAAIAEQAKSQGIRAQVCAATGDACRNADVVCTVTASREPVLADADIGPGTHVNAVGASQVATRELPPELVARARLVVDSLEGAMNEAGDIVLAIRDGVLPRAPQLTLLCDVIAGKAAVRTSDADVTIFKSLGIGLEDVACAALVYERAKTAGAGVS